MLNRDIKKTLNKYFQEDVSLVQLFSDVCDKLFGESTSFVISIGEEIKAGQKENDPAFYVFKLNNKYYINFEKTDTIILFNVQSEEKINEYVEERNALVRMEEERRQIEEAHRKAIERKKQKERIVFIDSEIDIHSGQILDLGAITTDQKNIYHGANIAGFKDFVKTYQYVVGHNIIRHDLKYVADYLKDNYIPIDTLYFSALLFPKKPYHKLIKDDKLRSFEKNNPVNDARKSKALFYDEINAFHALDDELKEIYCLLLKKQTGFAGFFDYVDYESCGDVVAIIKTYFDGKICTEADIEKLCAENPVELAYALAIITTGDDTSSIPPWILRNYPETYLVIQKLRNTPCGSCKYCTRQFDIHRKLKEFFGYDHFRLFEGKPLQEEAVSAAIHGESIIAVFPTGGGKSVTFQLPALMAGQTEHALTVVISPLQALMKDQVDNLSKFGIMAVAINGLLDPISRKEAIDRVENGTASILYIAPESLRNNTVRNLLKNRVIARFVIDEAHCFSSWGQDFRVDYLYIGKFIRELQEEKRLPYSIPVSCFTATAGEKVIEDISDYFHKELGLSMRLFIASSERKNLEYEIRDLNGNDKYPELRTLITAHNCPTIVYVFSVKKTYEIADRLCNDGIAARAFNGEMNSIDKQETQEAFINNEIDVIVATSAFGMGVDKDDVGLVIHYQMPSSIEDYMQESGRAGRKEDIRGECIGLYDEKDIDFLFYFLNQTKLTKNEIQSVWGALKRLFKGRTTITKSAVEIAKEAGWTDNTQRDTDISVRAAIGALEDAGYIERLNNVTWVFATGIIPKNMEEAAEKINRSERLDGEQKKIAILIISNLFGSRSRAKAGNEDSSKRTDYLADILGVEHAKVIEVIDYLKEIGVLADSSDLKAYIYTKDTKNKSLSTLEKYRNVENLMIENLNWEDGTLNFKEFNEVTRYCSIRQATPAQIKTILFYWAIKEYVSLGNLSSTSTIQIKYQKPRNDIKTPFSKRHEICDFIIRYLFEKHDDRTDDGRRYVEFSLLELKAAYENQLILHEGDLKVSIKELQDALIYMQRIGSMDIEGGFFVMYQPFKIKRLEMNYRKKYTVEDYKKLQIHYAQKVRQVHMVDEFSKLMMRNKARARQFALDYFELDNDAFDKKYFSRERIKALKNNISPSKYTDLFGSLSEVQKDIINDDESQHIMVAAGPGSGKTMVLVHKLASLILLEDVKCEQLLMLTFSRLAATEFKERLIKLIGNAAYGVEIKTFHSYCFDILGRRGDTSEFNNIVGEAVSAIQNGEIELDRITKAVLVIDEAQDINSDEYQLIRAIMEANEEMRVIMVGDDDQNIFEFRGSNSMYMKQFADENNAVKYHMIDNYRSGPSVVQFANEYADKLRNRLKNEPIRAVTEEKGIVTLTKYNSENLETPLIRKIVANKSYNNTCILTWTNEEALRVVGALSEQGINARLIQGDDKLRLRDIAEISRFKDIIDEETQTPVISKDTWLFARDVISDEYSRSRVLKTCLTIIDRFETTNDPIYMTDFEEYLTESKYEDFIEGNENEIVVSTIHKSKGREFETVYLVLNNCEIATEENKRVIYVGATRAKKNLHILCNNDVLNDMKDCCDYMVDSNIYEYTAKTQLQLSYPDVWLDYFMNYQSTIQLIRSGDKLRLEGSTFWLESNSDSVPVARLSNAGARKVRQLQNNNTTAKVDAEVRFIVHWFKTGTNLDNLIILPTINIDRGEPEYNSTDV